MKGEESILKIFGETITSCFSSKNPILAMLFEELVFHQNEVDFIQSKNIVKFWSGTSRMYAPKKWPHHLYPLLLQREWILL